MHIESIRGRAPVLPTREYTIIELVNTITDKPDWQRKVFDDAIVTRWRAEALAQNTLADTFKIKPETQSAEVVEGSIDTDRNVEDDRSEAGRSDSTSSLWPASHGRVDVSPRMVDWAIAEVKYKAGIFEHISCIEALDGVWKSDTFVDEKLRGALELAVRPLEDVPEVRAILLTFSIMTTWSSVAAPMKPRATYHAFLTLWLGTGGKRLASRIRKSSP